MTSTFDLAVDFVLRWEGGLSDDPQDSGKLTKWGISQTAHPTLDIKNLTREAAIQIYRESYWDRCHCSQLPAQLAILLFDSAVNQGPIPAIRMMQNALQVTADGVVGPETIGAGHRADLRAVTAEFVARRAFAYSGHPQVARFGLGWYRRLAACHQLTMQPF